MNNLVLCYLVTLLGASLPIAAPATVLISNLPGNDGTSTTISNSSGATTDDSKAAGFTLPTGSGYFLADVILRLDVDVNTVPLVAIYSNNGSNNPGTLLQTLANPTFTTVGAPANFAFHSTTPLALVAATTYWIVVSDVSSTPSEMFWLASTPGIAPTGIATNAGYRFSTGAPPPTGNSTTFNSYAVDVVPEPSTWVLLGLGAVGAGVVALRRQQRTT